MCGRCTARRFLCGKMSETQKEKAYGRFRLCRLRLRNDSQAGQCRPLMGISAAARTAIACRFLSGCVCGADAGETKNGGQFMDVSQLSINTAVTLAEVYRYADTIFRASPPEAASRRQRKIRRWMCRYIRNMPELPKETRRKLLHCEQAAFFAFLQHCMAVAREWERDREDAFRKAAGSFDVRVQSCGNSCGWSIGRMCKTRQAFSESS